MIIASYFNHLPDGQRGTTWEADKALLQPLIDSCERVGVPLVILNNCFEESGPFVVAQPDPLILPNMARWICIVDYLNTLKLLPEWLFCVDSTDVEVMRMPEPQTGIIYSGDELGMKVGNEWMKRYQRCFVRIKDYDAVIALNANKPLLNCGIVGGKTEDVFPFLKQLAGLHKLHSRHVPGEASGSTDMATYNYLMYKKYVPVGVVKHGHPVNSVFKKHEQNTTAWFRHK
jgi:hypothetical protein